MTLLHGLIAHSIFCVFAGMVIMFQIIAGIATWQNYKEQQKTK